MKTTSYKFASLAWQKLKSWCMDVPSSVRLRCNRETPFGSRRFPLRYSAALFPCLTAPASRQTLFAPSTVTTITIAPELVACIVVSPVFLVLPLNARTTATVGVSAPIVSSRRVPFFFCIAVQLSFPVPLSTISVDVAVLTLPVTMSAVLMPAASFAVVAVSSF